MANLFKKGDIVVMKSGGPPMTVDAAPGEQQEYVGVYEEYHCKWFKGATKQNGAFGEHLLEKYIPPKK